MAPKEFEQVLGVRSGKGGARLVGWCGGDDDDCRGGGARCVGANEFAPRDFHDPGAGVALDDHDKAARHDRGPGANPSTSTPDNAADHSDRPAGGRACGGADPMTVELLRRADILELLESEDRHPLHRLGQNFVVDPGTIRRIVARAGVSAGDRVLEIGPGLGSLTLGLLDVGAAVTCVEKDPEIAALLGRSISQRAPGAQVVIECGDALDVDLAALCPGPSHWKLVANLPYNIATQVVLRVLDEAPSVGSMLVMVQREVAERLAASPGGRSYGIPSVILALRATAKLSATVPPEVFYPRPRVTSALVAIERREAPVTDPDTELVVRQLVRAAFGQRRKTLRRSLGLPEEVFARAGIDGAERPERLSVQDWCRLAVAR